MASARSPFTVLSRYPPSQEITLLTGASPHSPCASYRPRVPSQKAHSPGIPATHAADGAGCHRVGPTSLSTAPDLSVAHSVNTRQQQSCTGIM